MQKLKNRSWMYLHASVATAALCAVTVLTGPTAHGQSSTLLSAPTNTANWREQMMDVLRRAREKLRPTTTTTTTTTAGTALAQEAADLIDKTINEGLRDDLTLWQYAELVEDAGTLLQAAAVAQELNAEADPALLELLHAAGDELLVAAGLLPPA